MLIVGFMELICFSIGRTDLWVLVQGQPRQHIKKQRHYFINKGPSSQSYGFSNGHVWCDSWTIKKTEHRRIRKLSTEELMLLNCGVGEDS